ncbi:hypothetical protein KUCAC02_006545 [Chaenocephalus aceratus]|uniref:Uncharacterized protein n=1 Tax=Chaenocephalus aceratus TaxID=36190 RepID=A0ACB9VSN1_CHAAC|nr:hypothetical protein KUCAC02_006545 [Chaenocephalus aceratus]
MLTLQEQLQLWRSSSIRDTWGRDVGDGMEQRQLVSMLHSNRPPGQPVGMSFCIENGEERQRNLPLHMVTRSLLSSYMRLVRRTPAGDWCSVVAVAACAALWGGRGRYKSLLPHTQSFTLEEENLDGVYFRTLYRPGTRTCSEKNLHSTSPK